MPMTSEKSYPHALKASAGDWPWNLWASCCRVRELPSGSVHVAPEADACCIMGVMSPLSIERSCAILDCTSDCCDWGWGCCLNMSMNAICRS